MTVFTIHTPSTGRTSADPAAEAVFVREGFSRWAFVLGPLWLLWNRRWIMFGLWFLAFACVFFAVRRLGFDGWLLPAFYFGVGILLGLEAPVLRRAALRGRGFTFADVAIADSRKDAELMWFARRRPLTTPILATPAAPAGAARAYPPVGLFPDVAPGQRS